MADDFNLVLEHLRAIRGDLAEVKTEGRLQGQRLSSVERHLSTFHSDLATFRDELDGVKERLGRIETRLGLAEAQH